MPGDKVKNFLNENSIFFNIIKHPTTFTAQGTAHSAHISGKNIAKTVIIKIDNKVAMAVLPANQKVNAFLFKDVFTANSVDLASEDEFKDLFPDCEIGAMPPFGNLYNMDIYVSVELSKDETIAFNAGTHNELIQMKFSDFKKLVKPKIFDFAI